MRAGGHREDMPPVSVWRGSSRPARYLHVVSVRRGAPLVISGPKREAAERPLGTATACGERVRDVERHAVVRVERVGFLKLARHLNDERRVGGSNDRVALPRARHALRVPVGPCPPVTQRKARPADRLSRRSRHSAASPAQRGSITADEHAAAPVGGNGTK